MPTYDYDRFITRKFVSSKSHVPPGGLGAFEAKFDPQTGKMEVEVRVCPRMINRDMKPVDPTVSRRFLDAFTQKIPEYWDNRYRFTCRKRDFEQVTVEPSFRITESNLEDAHYDLKILNMDRGSICVRTGADPAFLTEQRINDPTYAAYRSKLSAQFNNTAVDASSAVAAKNILEAIEKPVTIALGLSTGVGSYSVVAVERIRRHAEDLRIIFQGVDVPKLTITGPGPKGKATAKTVESMLRSFGYAGKVTHAKNGPPNSVTIALNQKQFLAAKTRILGDLTNFPQFAQYAVVHEYGHMLGLPDEYMCCGAGTIGLYRQVGLGSGTEAEKEALEQNTTRQQQGITDNIENTQTEFVKLCQAAGVPAPPFGRSNPSLMSSGLQFLGAHAVTVVHSLTTMMSNYEIGMGDWRIDVIR